MGNPFNLQVTKVRNMSDFLIWFKTGIYHITDWEGYDHMLFLLITTGFFIWRDIKKVLYLITGFTIGHSLTLALSVFEVIRFNSTLIEILIPVTILLTAIYQLTNKQQSFKIIPQMTFIVLFGLIHGMGFSGLLRSMLGKETDILIPLLSFNLGIEAGQIAIVVVLISISTLLFEYLKINQKIYIISVSLIVIALSIIMIVQRIPQNNEEKKEIVSKTYKSPYFCKHSINLKSDFSLYA